MALIPEDQNKHHFTFEIAKVLKASGSGYGIVAVVVLALMVFGAIALLTSAGVDLNALRGTGR